MVCLIYVFYSSKYHAHNQICFLGTVRDSSKVIKSNIFYVLEYREFILTLLVNYDELKMSDTYLKDLIETQHIFLKMLEIFIGKDGSVMVQSKGKRRRKKQSKKGIYGSYFYCV